jgi:polyisoprenoid-binding protein YceI
LMALLPICAALVALASARQAQDSIVYLLSPASRFEVKTGKSGLLGFAGHAHIIRARAFSGRMVLHPSASSAYRVEIKVPADSLEVLTPPDTAEIRKVTAAMRTEVLRVDRYPEITFVSTAITPIDGGYRVLGKLTLVSQSRDVSVDMRVVEQGADTVRATGSFSIKQTDFGIRPYRGGPAGAVRVADKVTFGIEAVGIRQEPQKNQTRG